MAVRAFKEIDDDGLERFKLMLATERVDAANSWLSLGGGNNGIKLSGRGSGLIRVVKREDGPVGSVMGEEVGQR